MSELAVRLEGVGKRYKVFAHRRDYALDAFGFYRLMPWLDAPHREFWALRHIDLQLDRGQRLGVIGRNGAGKTTLLKLITGNLAPTEGTIDVNGQVHALLDVGGGFHPEFSGRENVRAALTYQGMNTREIRAAESKIAEFTDLVEFFDQPFKTYSQGMQARLTFACATTITPEVLIVDEVLGAGDAAFYRRSTERMSELIHNGATVFLVSHALQQVQRFCEESIWLEHGEIIMRGATTDVVKAYEKFSREVDERRMREIQQRVISTGETVSEPSLAGVSEWTDRPGLRIVQVAMEGKAGEERAIFEVGGPFRVRVRARAQQDGLFPLTPVALVFRPDGLIVTRHLGVTETIEMRRGDEVEALLDFGSLQLGNGDYLLSVGMWANIDPDHVEPSTYYHHLDRSYTFRIVGNPPMHDELFVHPGSWRMKLLSKPALKPEVASPPRSSR
jgi:lipopolysaccharide transport system ATP-binding protein